MKQIVQTLIPALFAVAFLQPAHAETVLIEDGFSAGSVSTTTNGFRLRESSIGEGWQAARKAGGSEWTVDGGTLKNASTVSTPGYPHHIPSEAPVAQGVGLVGLDIADTATQLVLSFDYAVGEGDTLYVTLWGHTGTFSSDSNKVYANLENRHGLGNLEATSDLDTFNLLDGATKGFGGKKNPLVALTGGTSGTYTTTIDLTTLGAAGVAKVNDITAVTIGLGKKEDGNPGVTSIDNLKLVAGPAAAP